MKRSRSLIFDGEGLINSSDITFISENHNLTTIILAGDGSKESFERIKEFQSDPVLTLSHIGRIGIARTPRYELKIVGGEFGLSLPNYVYSKEDVQKWICSKIVAPHLTITMTDISSQSGTYVELEPEVVEAVCYKAHQLWEVLTALEDRLSFPAIVIDRLLPLTYSLTPGNMDIITLRKETGISSLQYSRTSDMLSVEIGGDSFSAKVSTLNDIYGELILPRFRSLLLRRIQFTVALKNNETSASIMSYGQIGKLIEDMSGNVQETSINVDNPLSRDAVSKWAYQLRVDDESCIWVERNETLEQTIIAHQDDLMLRSERDDLESDHNTLESDSSDT